ncbi:MAG TPA: hypothetical protein VGD73_31550 [Pseudonocardia sp.]|uniref:hypothetical protein n=1 Tax=Pseudonocardia sp. TaxID=60912 RepID=UPI002ED8E68F
MTSTAPLPAPEDAPKPPVGDQNITDQNISDQNVSDQDPVDPGAVGAGEQLRWFSTLWVIAAAVHYTDSHPLGVLPVLALGLPVLVFPTSTLAFGLFVAGAGVSGAMSLPAAANHKMLSLLVALAFAAAALCVWVTRNRPDTQGTFLARWLETARTPVGLTLLVVYLFTVFDKLNTGFFDPATSCAGRLLDQMLDYDGITLEPNALVVRASASTVLVEATILVCLAVPRLRRWGLLLGVGFHLVLAPASFWDFATMVFAVYVLFVPPRIFAGLAPRSAGPRRIALAAFGLHVLLSITVTLSGTTDSAFGPRWHTLLVLTWYLALVPMMAQLVRACLTDRGPWPGWRVRPALLLLIPLLAFVNGAAPWLGLKTVASYSMFSNLHTEPSATNHLLPGLTALQLVPYQRDTVTITKVDVIRDRGSGTVIQPRWTREKPPTTVPLLEVRRMVGDWRDAGVASIHLEYQRGGVTHVVPNALTDPDVGAPLPWWQQHLLAFRAISSADGPDICRW